jgi:hypothetical protein
VWTTFTVSIILHYRTNTLLTNGFRLNHFKPPTLYMIPLNSPFNKTLRQHVSSQQNYHSYPFHDSNEASRSFIPAGDEEARRPPTQVWRFPAARLPCPPLGIAWVYFFNFRHGNKLVHCCLGRRSCHKSKTMCVVSGLLWGFFDSIFVLRPWQLLVRIPSQR